MVHKNSEYRLQFHKLSNDIRAQIWRENALLRQKLKNRNLSDHYWRYQLIDDACECDQGDTASIERDLQRATVESSQKTEESTFSSVHDKGVQTSSWDSKSQGEYCLTKERTECLSDENHNSSLRNDSKLGAHGDSLSKTANTSHNVRTTVNHKICAKENNKNPLNFSSEEQTSVNPVKGATLSYLNPSPTRNALNSYQSQSKTNTVFAPFGWNDSHKDVGDQKTFNVRAPIHQVHPSALLASGKRLLEIESYLAEQQRKRRQHNLSFGPINSSSIWMTEYQESFSKGHRAPLSKSNLARPIVWRYT